MQRAIRDLLLILAAVLCLPAGALPDCNAMLSQMRQRAGEKLGYEPKLYTEELKPLDQVVNSQRYEIVAKNPVLGNELATVEFTVYDGGNTLRIEGINVHGINNRFKNLSNYLFAQMMAQHPSANKIVCDAGFDNLDHLEKAMADTDNCAEAFKATPMYKSAAHFGFTKISPDCNPQIRSYTFVLELEPAH